MEMGYLTEDKRDEARVAIVGNTALLLSEEAMRLGKLALYNKMFYPYTYTGFMMRGVVPDSVEEYAFDRTNGAVRLNAVPSWASEEAVAAYFADELSEDFAALVRAVRGADATGQEADDGR